MLDGKNNLREMSLVLNKYAPIFQLLREKLGLARRPRSRLEQRFGDGPFCYMIS